MNMKFTQTHEWIKPETHDIYTIGISEHAQSLLGDMVYVELPEPGKTVSAGDSIAVVESVKAASDVYAPVSGVIVEINSAVQENPATINLTPYDAWLIKIKPNHPEDLNMLMDEAQYQSTLSED